MATNQLTSQGVQGTTEYNYGVTATINGEESEMVETAEHLVIQGPHPDPVPCMVATWSTWGTCSKTCGRGASLRRREVTQQPLHDGLACPALEEKRACNTELCEGKI